MISPPLRFLILFCHVVATLFCLSSLPLALSVYLSISPPPPPSLSRPRAPSLCVYLPLSPSPVQRVAVYVQVELQAAPRRPLSAHWQGWRRGQLLTPYVLCVCSSMKLIFPPIYNQHNQCPCRCLVLVATAIESRASSVGITTRQRFTLQNIARRWTRGEKMMQAKRATPFARRKKERKRKEKRRKER